MRIDAHQHFWRLDRGDYDWLTPELDAIYRDFLPGDLDPLLERHGIDGTILVQAAASEAETLFMLELAARHDFIKGVVGWTDFAAENAPQRIAALARDPKLVGFRPMIQDIADPDWMLGPGLDPAYRALIGEDLVFDALTLPQHLGNLLTLTDRYPELRVVIDHGSKPQIANGAFDDWAADMRTLARDSDAFCKLSGLVTEAGPSWTTGDLQRYTDHLIDVFGPSRLIWGSDWPVCTLAASYDAWVAATDILLTGLTDSQRAAVLGGNAVRAYLG